LIDYTLYSTSENFHNSRPVLGLFVSREEDLVLDSSVASLFRCLFTVDSYRILKIELLLVRINFRQFINEIYFWSHSIWDLIYSHFKAFKVSTEINMHHIPI
jgi:hypothetical protein